MFLSFRYILVKNGPKIFLGWRGCAMSWGFGNSTKYLRFVSKENLEGFQNFDHVLPPLVKLVAVLSYLIWWLTRGGNKWTIFISMMRYPSKFSLETNLRYMVLFPKPQDITLPLQPQNVLGLFSHSSFQLQYICI